MTRIPAVLATVAVIAAGAAVPSTADARPRGGAVAAGVIGGLAAGAIIGSMANQRYYGDGYYAPGYAYGPGYTYGPDPYAYEAPPVYVRPVPRRYDRGGGCWIATDTSRGYGYYGPCY